MILSVEHELRFEYDGYISESVLEVRVQPKTDAHQTVIEFTLAVGPRTRVDRYTDWHENVVHHFNVTRYHNRIEVVSRSLVTTHPTAPALADVDDAVPLPAVPFRLRDFLQFGRPVPLTAALRAFARDIAQP